MLLDQTLIFSCQTTVQLRDAWASEISNIKQESSAPVQIDVLSWLSRMTLDVIGLAGEFNAKVVLAKIVLITEMQDSITSSSP